jgi:hypothetical protein
MEQELEPNQERWTVLNLLASAEPLALSMQIPQICRRLGDWSQLGWGEPLCHAWPPGAAEATGGVPTAQVPDGWAVTITPMGRTASWEGAVALVVEAWQVHVQWCSESLIEELLAVSVRDGIDDRVDAVCQGLLWTGGPREDHEEIAMIGILQDIRR